MKKSERTKADIIKAAIELLEENGNADIPISAIAKRADVAVGLINYHYESKQALIADAVKCYIEEYIQKDNVFMLGMLDTSLSPRETLTASFISYADFLAKHAALSRLHIKFSLDGAFGGETIKLALDYYLPIMEKLNSGLSAEQLLIALRMISSGIQMAFLEANTTAEVEENSFDFFDKTKRDEFINTMISLVIGEEKREK